MIFGFVAKHRGIWPVAYLCEALGVSRSGFYAWLTRRPSAHSRCHEVLSAKIRSSFADSDRTYGARRVWHDLLAAGIECGLHAIERLMRRNGLRARPRRRRLPIDLGDRPAAATSANVLDRRFEAPAPNRKWVADFTYIWTGEGWLYVAAVIDLFSRMVVGWSMSAAMWPGLLVGDLSQPRGGPMVSGHASHQVGLDADIWLTPMPDRRLTEKEREDLSAASMLAEDEVSVDPKVWTDAHVRLLKRTASYPAVERIFVHPAIKKALCEATAKDTARGWLHKVRA